MFMQEKYSPEKLIKKYLEGTCNEQEKAIVESWHLYDLSHSDNEPSQQSINSAYTRGRQKVISHMQVGGTTRQIWQRVAVAAAILIFLGAGTFFFFSRKVDSNSAQNSLSDIAPGGNRAILTLANGRQINLTNAKNGQIALQDGTSVNKTADGKLTYAANTAQANNSSKIAYNSISTPVGGQYHLVLEDGTNVWLNAASSIKYPTIFTGAERKVEVTGEVYFEVAHNAAKPFRVASNQQVIEVLGTHFNVNAYPDEASTKTTLLQGSVKVSTASASIIIKPGQQSVLLNRYLSINQATDLGEAVAWKNGYFQFKDEKISSVMRELSRWYNIEVEYDGKLAEEEGFNGTISRSKNISQVLKMLERTKAVHFSISGRRVTIIL
jgi:transmembrane sensor